MSTTPNPQPTDISHGLQEIGEQGLENAPAPLTNATRDVGVQFTPASKDNGPTQNTVQGVNAVAGVQQGEPRQIQVDDPKAFAANKDLVAPHELYHVWQANLPPSLSAKIPASTSKDDYKYPTVDEMNQMRKDGKTLLDVPAEKAAQMMAYATHFHDNPDVQKAVKPFLDDMRKYGRSVVEATGPNDKDIRTKPRAPMGPSDDIPGMEGFRTGKVDLSHGLQKK